MAYTTADAMFHTQRGIDSMAPVWTCAECRAKVRAVVMRGGRMICRPCDDKRKGK